MSLEALASKMRERAGSVSKENLEVKVKRHFPQKKILLIVDDLWQAADVMTQRLKRRHDAAAPATS